MDFLKTGVLQLNFTVGDLQKNAEKILRAIRESDVESVDLFVAPELSFWGYPPKDLLLEDSLLDLSENVLGELAHELKNSKPLLLGIPERVGRGKEKQLFNSAALLENGESRIVARKRALPNYGVFNERRYFDSDSFREIFSVCGKKILVTVCEDMWIFSESFARKTDRTKVLANLEGVNFDQMINLSASPFEKGKAMQRKKIAQEFSSRFSIPVLYCNTVGSNDGLVFDGRSFLCFKKEIQAELPAFEESVQVVGHPNASVRAGALSSDCEEIRQALLSGIRDYFSKNGFQKAVLGLSGGIDSALVCALATEALGPDHVFPVLMPSKFSGSGSIDDSLQLAKNLGLKTTTIEIAPMFDAFLSQLTPPVEAGLQELTEENLQPRIRGNLLMALAGEWNALLLATGNKSELAVGYCTIYGDMCGALAVIADLWKTEVYELAEWWNREKEIIPKAILTKAPSAELKPNQTDQDKLPDYATLDAILKWKVEERLSLEEIINKGFQRETVKDILNLLKIAEFKRYQAPPLIRISKQSLGSDRQMPLSARYL